MKMQWRNPALDLTPKGAAHVSAFVRPALNALIL